MALEVFGEEVILPDGYWRSPSAEKKDEAVCFIRLFEKLLNAGKIQPHPVQVLPPGFEGVLEGLAFLQSGNVFEVKHICKLEQT
ncbi:hypothetical protein F4677DRAFT_422296 [Hypoxylon crocopeplum]|nr:hypothetical protein F4677DRAFT_422296 [Hypoxylon crocopeplum]